jgi:hypothetical protein
MTSEIRIISIVSSLAILTLVAACEDASSESSQPEPAAARAPASLSEEPEQDEESEPSESDDAPTDDDIELTWFKGVDNLPQSHPCHDSATAVHATLRLPRDRDGVGDPFDYEISTLGELRERLGPRWVHFGPRTARGVRWEGPDGEHLVATCNMGGVGFDRVDDTSFLEDEGVDMEKAADAEWVVGQVGEASSEESGGVAWMTRGADDEAWTSVHDEYRASNADEGNDPQYVARARIISAGDADHDRMPEVVVVAFEDRRGWKDEDAWTSVCPDVESKYRCTGFQLEIMAREGDQALTDRVFLRLDGQHALTEEAEIPEDMSDEVFDHLRAQLDEHRDDAVGKARAILREDEKLQ